jgi:hypothetical protein
MAGTDVTLQDQLIAAVGDHRGLAAADQLCLACVMLFDVEAAAISAVYDGINMGTVGVSSPSARRYDELQFTYGEGPCLDAVHSRGPVASADLAHPKELRWPAFRPALVAHTIRSVYAAPVVVAGEYVGALDLFRTLPGDWHAETSAGALIAAQMATVPFMDLLADDSVAAISDPASDAWTELSQFARAEVSQATGMLVAQLDVTPSQALVRLRAHAYATGRSATEVARDIIERRLRLDAD